jgi:hypothetical protein
MQCADSRNRRHARMMHRLREADSEHWYAVNAPTAANEIAPEWTGRPFAPPGAYPVLTACSESFQFKSNSQRGWIGCLFNCQSAVFLHWNKDEYHDVEGFIAREDCQKNQFRPWLIAVCGPGLTVLWQARRRTIGCCSSLLIFFL